MKNLAHEQFDDIGIAKIDTTRFARTGIDEVIFGAGKTVEQTVCIAEKIIQIDQGVFITKTSSQVYEILVNKYPEIQFNALAKTISLVKEQKNEQLGTVSIINAGTSDLPISEEVFETLKYFGISSIRINDVGVAGIHRVLSQQHLLQSSDLIIVVAGMEGALPSVIGGLVKAPIIAVPTSVGYGSSFEGLAALLTMMNSCAPGVTVVNIDNGFGAAVVALKIMNMICRKRESYEDTLS